MLKRFLFILHFQLLIAIPAFSWGFWAHQQINRQAVFSLPPEMIVLYKRYHYYLSENAVNPDRRRYAVKGEAPRHYIDVDVYGDSAVYNMPRYWSKAVERYGEDTLQAYGIVPWHVNSMRYWLTEAFRQKDLEQILRLSAELGHYIADANVPLHTTLNYNGQLTGQRGIHGLWESRLPELFAEDYDLLVGKAEYLSRPQVAIWQAVAQAHEAKDSVLLFEQKLSARFPADKKYSLETKGRSISRQYSRKYARAYHRMLSGQVARQMRSAIKMVADFWYTAWVDAGMPDLNDLTLLPEVEADTTQKQKAPDARECVR